jgi:hypothetical protein
LESAEVAVNVGYDCNSDLWSQSVSARLCETAPP